jgi:ComF family protein
LKIKPLISSGLDFILPNSCQACGTKIHLDEVLLCRECFSKIELIQTDFAAEQYERHFSRDKYITDYCSLYVFEKESPLQTLLHNMKYRNHFRNGINLGQLTARANEESLRSWNLDLIAPVPLHRIKKAERGYNQSFYIGKGISSILKVKLKPGIMRRRKITESQTKLHIDERKNNVENAFEVKKRIKVEGKTILLVDDVITTGSTINECAKVLVDSGAQEVYAASIALA